MNEFGQPYRNDYLFGSYAEARKELRTSATNERKRITQEESLPTIYNDSKFRKSDS